MRNWLENSWYIIIILVCVLVGILLFCVVDLIFTKYRTVFKDRKEESLKLIRIFKSDEFYVLLCEKERLVILPEDDVKIKYVYEREDMIVEATYEISDCFMKRLFLKEKKVDEQVDISYKVYILDGSIEETFSFF